MSRVLPEVSANSATAGPNPESMSAARFGTLQEVSEIEVANRRLLHWFSRVLIPLLGIVLLVLIVAFGAMFIAVTRNATGEAPDKVLVVHLVQVGIGLTLGFLCLFLGVVMCWFGITGTFSVIGQVSGAKLDVKGSQMGIILLIGGMSLTALSLHKSYSLVQADAQQSGSPQPMASQAFRAVPGYGNSESVRARANLAFPEAAKPSFSISAMPPPPPPTEGVAVPASSFSTIPLPQPAPPAGNSLPPAGPASPRG
jgi:hypothetical protein